MKVSLKSLFKSLYWLSSKSVRYDGTKNDVEFYFTGNPLEVIVGTNSYGRVFVHNFQDSGVINIGKYTSISDIHLIIGGNHHTGITTFPLKARFLKYETQLDNKPAKGIAIGSDCWLGFNATVLDGVNIGDGAIVGAQSVVTGNVLPYSIVAGNPARMIRKRFSEDIIDKLMDMKWWDLQEQIILDNIDVLYGMDAEEFIRIINSLKEHLV